MFWASWQWLCLFALLSVWSILQSSHPGCLNQSILRAIWAEAPKFHSRVSWLKHGSNRCLKSLCITNQNYTGYKSRLIWRFISTYLICFVLLSFCCCTRLFGYLRCTMQSVSSDGYASPFCKILHWGSVSTKTLSIFRLCYANSFWCALALYCLLNWSVQTALKSSLTHSLLQFCHLNADQNQIMNESASN